MNLWLPYKWEVGALALAKGRTRVQSSQTEPSPGWEAERRSGVRASAAWKSFLGEQGLHGDCPRATRRRPSIPDTSAVTCDALQSNTAHNTTQEITQRLPPLPYPTPQPCPEHTSFCL